MVKEGLKKILPVMQAFVEGKTIQRYDNKKDNWYDVSPNANIDFCYDYRIKPEPNYRPFKNQEECWNEMLKHQPLGWCKDKNSESLLMVTAICDQYIYFDGDPTEINETFDFYEFADGTPFGVKEE